MTDNKTAVISRIIAKIYQFQIGIARTHAAPDGFPGNMHGRARSPEEMEALGAKAAAFASPGRVIALVGGLGAGKTHWTKGFVAGLGSTAEVTSPTFGLVHEYPGGNFQVFHFDFYRLDSAEELLALGWDEYTEEDGVIIAEWGNKFPEILPAETIWLQFRIEEDGSRTITDGRPVT